MIFKEISSVESFFWNMLSDPTSHRSRKGRKLFTKSGSFFCQLRFGKPLNSNLVKCKNNSLSTNKQNSTHTGTISAWVTNVTSETSFTLKV